MTRRAQICPFDLTVEPIDRMLNFELPHDPHYEGLEIQYLDDSIHGTGMAVLLNRREDGLADVYREPGLRLDPAGYQIMSGLGRWEVATFDRARLDITPHGVDAQVRFTDADGRAIEVRVNDRSLRRRRPGRMLAPMGAAIERPRSLMLVWMGLDLVRRSGPQPEIRIDGRPALTGRLPGAWLHRRHLIKWATDLAVVRCNPSQEGPLGPPEARVERNDDGIVRIRAAREGHKARFELRPALPDLDALPEGRPVELSWRIGIDEAPEVCGGTLTARRGGDRVDLELEVTRGWRPGRLPPLMKVVTRLIPTFRRWPTTYRWSATVTLGDEPTMSSGWERTGTERADAYERVTA